MYVYIYMYIYMLWATQLNLVLHPAFLRQIPHELPWTLVPFLSTAPLAPADSCQTTTVTGPALQS